MKGLHGAKDLAFLAMMTALLLGGQLVLSSVSGVEVVTVLLLCFAYSFGSARGMLVATAFSLLRCFLFGFFLHVILLYLIYFNAFAFVWGKLGKHGLRHLGAVVPIAVLCTVCFTLIDNILWPLIGGLTWDGTKIYWLGSLSAVIPQSICTAVTVLIGFYPLTKIFGTLAQKI